MPLEPACLVHHLTHHPEAGLIGTLHSVQLVKQGAEV